MGLIHRMRREEAISPTEFYSLLDRWFRTTPEQTIGDTGAVQGRTPWMWVLAGGQECRLHADATRDGVGHLLKLRREEPALEWHVVANQRGVFNKIAFGAARRTIPGVFLYLREPVAKATRIL